MRVEYVYVYVCVCLPSACPTVVEHGAWVYMCLPLVSALPEPQQLEMQLPARGLHLSAWVGCVCMVYNIGVPTGAPAGAMQGADLGVLQR
jgi:hypothetical protein